jgi:hypothetical protein
MRCAIHYLSPAEARVLDWDGERLRPGDAPDGTAAVAVVDFPDESYVLATVPIMRGRDARLLRQRRLEREFPGATLSTLVPLRRRAAEGVTDAVMIAVPGGPPLHEALGAIASRQALRAVTTPAVLAAEWVRRARLRNRRTLIVLPTPAGVRLVFLDDARPTLSRLTGPLAPASTSAEIARTVQYLQNTQRVERGEAVELWFWGMDDATAAACLPTGVAVTPAAAPRLPALPDPERDGLDALLALAAMSPGRLQLAPDGLRLGWLAREYARWSRLAAAAVLAFAVLLGGVLEWRIAHDAGTAASLVAQRGSLEAEEAALAADLERRGLTLAEVATVPEAAGTLARGSLDPASVLVVVGTGFAAQSDVQVNGIEMRAAPLGDAWMPEEATDPAPDPVDAPADDATGDSGGDGAESCTGAAAPGVAMLVEFSLAEGLDVRRRDAALGWVREAADDLRPWRASAAARAIGRRDAVVVSADRDEAHAAMQWAVCLRREAGA